MIALAMGAAALLCFAAPPQPQRQAQPRVTDIEQADAAFRAGETEKAEVFARRAAGRNPGDAHAQMILGVIAAQREEWPAANRHFQIVVRLAPDDPNGHFYLGQAKLYQKQWDAAARNFERALALGFPDRDRLLVELAFADNEAGRPQRALERLTGVPRPDDAPRAAQYFAVTGFAHSKLGRPREAIEAIGKARDADATNPQYWEFLIAALIGTDQTPAALREAIQAQAKFPDHAGVQYLFALANYYVVESPLLPLALRNLREAEPATPPSPRVLLVEGMLFRKQGKTDEAIRAFEQAAQRGAPDSHLLLGIVYKENGNYDAAEREYRAAEKENASNGQVMLELGKLSLTRGQFEEARTRLVKAVTLLPDFGSAHYQLGLTYGRLGNKEKSEHHLNRSREIDRRQAEAQK